LLESKRPIDYLVSVKLDDEERNCSGIVGREDMSIYVIKFTPTHPLPECSNIREKFAAGPCDNPRGCPRPDK
jgi:hypothetical protein